MFFVCSTWKDMIIGQDLMAGAQVNVIHMSLL